MAERPSVTEDKPEVITVCVEGKAKDITQLERKPGINELVVNREPTNDTESTLKDKLPRSP
jgi:hypothetical protein